MGIAALFNPKAKKWVQGRKQIFKRLKAAIPPGEPITWIHCASLGEFEQARPLMEHIRSQIPHSKILLTFFSPSGFEVQKNYKGVDWVFYLPMDGRRNARRFLEIIHPSLVIFVKYEFWYYYMKKIESGKIPVLLISALFRRDMPFFKWYGSLQRKILAKFDHMFVQNESSKKLLDELGFARITSVSGDTRFDRVSEIAARFEPIPLIEQFIGNSKAIVAGSTWPEDEQVFQKAWESSNGPGLKLIIAPHDISKKHLTLIQELFPEAVLFSELTTGNPQRASANILIIDNIGMLSRLYRYGYITYVGGGMRTIGLHNILEAAVHYKPIIIGPYYKKYSEAVDLVNAGAAFVIETGGQLVDTINDLMSNTNNHYENAAKLAGDYVKQWTGATARIVSYIQEKRLLTS